MWKSDRTRKSCRAVMRNGRRDMVVISSRCTFQGCWWSNRSSCRSVDKIQVVVYRIGIDNGVGCRPLPHVVGSRKAFIHHLIGDIGIVAVFQDIPFNFRWCNIEYRIGRIGFSRYFLCKCIPAFVYIIYRTFHRIAEIGRINHCCTCKDDNYNK